MRVAVTYAEARRQALLEINVDAGATAEAAIRRSGILAKFPQIDLGTNKVGIFGKAVNLDQPLQEGDRVEIYRPALGSPPKKDRGGAEGEAPAAARPRSAARPAKGEAPAEAAAAEAAPAEAPAAEAAPAGDAAAEERAARIAAAKARAAAAKAAKAAPSE